jgi:CBS domain-containing protein
MFPAVNAKDLMYAPVITIGADATVAELCELMQFHHVNGVPVVDADGALVGIASEEDVLYGVLGLDPDESGGPDVAAPRGALERLRVSDIMTSPAITVEEETDLRDACRTMWKMRIHRLPVIADGEVRGILSAMDLVKAVADGEIEP